MGLQGIVVDVSGTLLGPSGAVEGIDRLWSLCRAHGIKIIAASNRPGEVARLTSLGYAVDFAAIPSTVGTTASPSPRKPSPNFVLVPAQKLGLDISKMLYVGDNETTDAFCASNARVPFLRADWAANPKRYGIGFDRLSRAVEFIEVFFLKDHPWFWVEDGLDSAAKPYRYRALIDCRDVSTPQGQLRDAAKRVLKDGDPRDRDFFLYHLFSSLHLSGITKELDLWTTYPGHAAGSVEHKVMHQFLAEKSIQFRDHAKALFVRHAPAESNRSTRRAGKQPQFDTQMATVHLDPSHRDAIRDKVILVVDDFTTATYSFEWGRNLLLAAGAREVIGVAIGKFGASFNTIAPKPGVIPLPFQPQTITSKNFIKEEHSPITRILAANDELQKSMGRYRAARSEG